MQRAQLGPPIVHMAKFDQNRLKDLGARRVDDRHTDTQTDKPVGEDGPVLCGPPPERLERPPGEGYARRLEEGLEKVHAFARHQLQQAGIALPRGPFKPLGCWTAQ